MRGGVCVSAQSAVNWKLECVSVDAHLVGDGGCKDGGGVDAPADELDAARLLFDVLAEVDRSRALSHYRGLFDEDGWGRMIGGCGIGDGLVFQFGAEALVPVVLIRLESRSSGNGHEHVRCKWRIGVFDSRWRCRGCKWCGVGVLR